jgi:hypothetical protein
VNDYAISLVQDSSSRFYAFLRLFLHDSGPYPPPTPKTPSHRVGPWPLGTPRSLGSRPLGDQIIPFYPWGPALWQVPFFSEPLDVPLLPFKAIFIYRASIITPSHLLGHGSFWMTPCINKVKTSYCTWTGNLVQVDRDHSFYMNPPTWR